MHVFTALDNFHYLLSSDITRNVTCFYFSFGQCAQWDPGAIEITLYPTLGQHFGIQRTFVPHSVKLAELGTICTALVYVMFIQGSFRSAGFISTDILRMANELPFDESWVMSEVNYNILKSFFLNH